MEQNNISNVSISICPRCQQKIIGDNNISIMIFKRWLSICGSTFTLIKLIVPAIKMLVVYI